MAIGGNLAEKLTPEQEFLVMVQESRIRRQELRKEFGPQWDYTTTFEPYWNALRGWLSDNKARLFEEGFTQQQISDAESLYWKLAMATDHDYFLNRPDWRRSDAEERQRRYLNDMAMLYHNVLVTGKIEGISEEFAMTKEEAVRQCARADKAFTERPDLQKLLADWNYSFFTGRTMATAKDLLNLSLDSFYTEGMPHLTASNGAIGHSVKQYILNRVKERETDFTINDMGSGSGATLAGIILGLTEADKELQHRIKVVINSIEGCHAFYEALRTEMVPAIKEKANSLRNIDLEINLHYEDILTEIKNIRNKGTGIYTANYVLHRLSDAMKKEVCFSMRWNNNSAFFLADIYRNTSEMPNRRYFNFAMNGPLNPGNNPMLMTNVMLTYGGFRTVMDDRELDKFTWLPEPILNACQSAKEKEQGFLITGYK